MRFGASKCVSERGGGWGSAPLRISNRRQGNQLSIRKTRISRMIQKTAHSGNSACVWLPEWNESV